MTPPAMTEGTTLDALLRRDRVIVLAALAAVVALAWVYLVVLARAMAAMAAPDGFAAFMGLMPMGRWGPWEYAIGFVMWALMMVGMMVPAALPVVLIHARVARRARAQARPIAGTAIFVLGYLGAWVAFSAVAAALQGALVRAALLTDGMTSASAGLAGAVLILAGLYQWTPQKRACLAHCRSPIHFLTAHWRPGRWGALGMGMHHGAYCVGCCWALMAVLFAVGIMNLAWVAAIAVIVVIEKTLPFGAWSGRVAGAALVILGIATLLGTVAGA
ncbi:MAG: DUF2182 domain-containing protein [Alphaproteobacteria bacterium]